MSYADYVAGEKAVLETVAGLALVLDYVPRTYQAFPLVYSMSAGGTLESADSADAAGSVPHHRRRHRLVLPWQDNEQCDRDLAVFIDSIPAAFEADPTLGGILTDGHDHIVSYDEPAWERNEQTGVVYRICDFISEVWEV